MAVSYAGPIEKPSVLSRINEQTDDYTLVAADDGALVDLNKGTAVTLTVPPDSSVFFKNGTQILVRQKGAGQVTIAAGSGVTVNAANSELLTNAQYSMAALVKITDDTWVASGDLTS